jgi:hypothetical protein
MPFSLPYNSLKTKTNFIIMAVINISIFIVADPRGRAVARPPNGMHRCY